MVRFRLLVPVCLCLLMNTALAFEVRVAEAPTTNLSLITSAIKSAKYSLLINIYEFTSPEIAEAIINRINAGVHVEILEEGQPVGGMSSVGRDTQDKILAAMKTSSKQNRFFEMYDALFNLQETRGYQAFTLDTLKATADNLKANSADMLNCMQRQEAVPVLQSSQALFQKLGAQGVPAVYVSTDGANYSLISDPGSGQPFSIPPIELLGLVIERANGAAQ